ncbi:hypothetical protein G3T14_15620 [Methylobacterium sp. BTF04]|uniref:hypothetical protein n=1 Tax=Methylobacterium sp. BTF04 TaxID=2708300 RepID=UPI0013D25110|nr:hypothetical protein [Methylobacterium sp. BTF04]NEU13550.1 hypothetical protein [Methylobacterium sp. BTF04]
MTAIYSARGDGLGTRMLAAIYGRILAELLELPLTVIWPPLGGADLYAGYALMHPDHLSEIFADRSLFTDSKAGLNGAILLNAELGDVRLQSAYHSQAEISGLSRGELLARLSDVDGLLYDFPGPLIAFMSTEVDLKRACIAAWSKVNWSDSVREAVEAVDARIDLSTCIAAHVRRGDILDVVNRGDLEHLVNDGMMQILQRYTPINAFFRQIDTSGATGGILVCTEDEGVIRRFCDRYGKARIASSMALDLTENQRAATDLLLLSRAKRIVAPVVSYFSTCAAAVSEAELTNTTWHLEASIDEITSLIDRTDPERVRKVSAIMNAAACRLVIGHEPDRAARFRARAIAFDEGLYRRVMP